jgi:hypothetical protein
MRATAAPTSAWSKPTSMSVGAAAMSQISTTGIALSASMRETSGGRSTPVSSKASGRRLSSARISSGSVPVV